jgi:D-aspartate ligase
MSLEKSTAIVFNCHYNGLSIIQSLGQRGISCIAMDTVRSIGTWSRYAAFVKCPDPASNETAFVNFLYDYCKALPVKPVLFPTNDHWATALARNKQRLSEVALPCVADWDAVKIVIEKEKFYEVGQARGYLTPATFSISELNQLPATRFPIVAKPQYRRNSSDSDQSDVLTQMDRLRLVVLSNHNELSGFLEKEKALLPYLVFQEFIPGLSDTMYTAGIYADHTHTVRAVFTGRKVRGYPADIGDCIIGEAHDVPKHLLDNTERVVKDLKLSGIAEFEYKRHSETGQFSLIEVNPRSWSWVGITPACGVDLPFIAYQDLRGETLDDSRLLSGVKRGAVRYWKVIPDLLNSTLRYKTQYPAWHKSLPEWWREFRSTPKVVIAEFHAKDYPVAIMSVIKGVAEYFRAVSELVRERFKRI